MFTKKSDTKDFWKEVFKVFSIIIGVLALVLLVSIGVTLIVKLLGMWTLVPFILIVCFAGSMFIVYDERRNRW